MSEVLAVVEPVVDGDAPVDEVLLSVVESEVVLAADADVVAEFVDDALTELEVEVEITASGSIVALDKSPI